MLRHMRRAKAPTPATPSVSAQTNANSTLPTATYYVRVVALTLEGYQNSSVSGGVATSKSITGADGKDDDGLLPQGSSPPPSRNADPPSDPTPPNVYAPPRAAAARRRR